MCVNMQKHNATSNIVHLTVGYNAECVALRLCLQALRIGRVPVCQKQGGLLFRRSCPLLVDWVSADMMDAKRL